MERLRLLPLKIHRNSRMKDLQQQITCKNNKETQI